jgi:RNase adapter protein RapZ
VVQGTRLVVVTGMSGAGKTQAIKCLEDLGFFCVDNLPPALMPKMAELCFQSEGKVSRLALGIDIRGGGFFQHAVGALEELERAGFPYRILFLEASDEVLVRRYKESRRRHPLALTGRILEGIRKERRMLEDLRGKASWILDTSTLAVNALRQELVDIFAGEGDAAGLYINVVSFGFKHGVPLDADLMFDVRFLPNPNYVPTLKELTGESPAVRDYVWKWAVTKKFFRRLTNLIGFLLPHYVNEGKSQLTIAIGCTGGQHRSVALGVRLAEWLGERGYQVGLEHRDTLRHVAEREVRHGAAAREPDVDGADLESADESVGDLREDQE